MACGRSRRRHILFVAALAAGLAAAACAGAADKYAGEFLTHGVGARALGMGSAFVAVADDVTAGYWNPAGAVDAGGRAVQLMHSETFGDIVNYDTGAYVHPLGDESAIALTFVRLGIDDIPFTDFEEDENRIYYDPARITMKTDSESALLVTYARRGSDRLRFGGNLKLIRKAVASYTCYGFGFDLGAKYDFWPGGTVGANIQDVTGTLLVWDTKTRERIAPTVKIGAAQRFDLPSMDGVLTLAADGDFRFEDRELADEHHVWRSTTVDTHYGVEFVYHDMVGVRAGLAMGQLTAGAGLSLGGFTVDYAFGKHEYLDSSHRVSASYGF